MKQYIVLIFLLFCSCSIFAQKEVRKNIRKGNSAYEDKRYTAAEESYQKALELNEADKDAIFNLANTYYRQQRWDDALKAYDDYVKLEDNNQRKSEAWSNIGNTFLKKKSVEKGQQQAMPNQQAGSQKKETDNLKQAIEAYKNALRLNANDDETRQNLAIAQKLVDEGGDGGGGDDNQDQNQDDNKDKNKDQDKKDQDKDKEQQDQDQQNKDQNKDDKKQDQEQQDNKISKENIQQILEAIEQDEKETQERVNKIKADSRKDKNRQNREQDKDW